MVKKPAKVTYFQVYGNNEGRVNARFSLREDATTSQKIKLNVYVLCIAQPEESNFQLFFLLFFPEPAGDFFNLFS